MNHVTGYSRAVPMGFWAMLRLHKDARPKPILGERGAPIIYATELEAMKAVIHHLCAYLNSPMFRDGVVIEAQSAADAVFKDLKPFTRQMKKRKKA